MGAVPSPRRPRKSIGRRSFGLESRESHSSLSQSRRLCKLERHLPEKDARNDAMVQWALGQPRDFEYTAVNILPEATLRGSPWQLPDLAGKASPYTADGRLLALCSNEPDVPQAVVEDGEQNVVRGGSRRHLAVFWAGSHTGWGVKACEDLRAGDFVCEYTGEVLADVDVEERCRTAGRDAYLFDLTTPSLCRGYGACPPSD